MEYVKNLATQGVQSNRWGALSSGYVSKLGSKEVIRHAELADCELRAEFDGKVAKPLQTSIVDPLNASKQAVSASITHPNLVLKMEGTLMEFGSR